MYHDILKSTCTCYIITFQSCDIPYLKCFKLSPSGSLQLSSTGIRRTVTYMEVQEKWFLYLNPTFKFYCTSTGTGILKIYWLPPRLHYSTFTRKYVGIVRGTRTASYELHKVYQYTVERTRTVLRTE